MIMQIMKVIIVPESPILIIASASADASRDVSVAKYSEMSAILGVLGQLYGPNTLLFDPPAKKW